MKKLIFSNAIVFSVALLLSGCEPDEMIPTNRIINIQFDSSAIKVHENEEQLILQLSFDRTTVIEGRVILSLTNVDKEKFTTEPATVNGLINLGITRNQSAATIKFKPVNNSISDGDRMVLLTLSDASDGFKFGTQKSVAITLVDDDSPSEPRKSIVNFIPTEGNLFESNPDGQDIGIAFSPALESAGSVEIIIESPTAVNNIHYRTIPETIGGRITFHPEIGLGIAKLKIVPIDNANIGGDLQIGLTISDTDGSIEKGTQLTQTLIISDDELRNKPKGYEVSAGSWSLKKIYEYDELGRVARVKIEKTSPATSRTTESYFYDGLGRIEKINTYPQTDVAFTWQNNQITKSETIDHGVVEEYTEYEYDVLGNVSGSANYYRQSDGQFKLGSLVVNFYFDDGNIYKSLYYAPADGMEEPRLISTRTYEGYIHAANPFPMVDILPTVKTQNKLPSSYRIEENGVDLRYTFTYEFRSDGLVNKRTNVSNQATETAHYLYY